MRTTCVAQGSLLNACGDLNAQEVQKAGDMCTSTANPFHSIAKTNATF